MNIGLYQAAAALNTAERWQEVVAQNLASAGVPGFKKQELSFTAVEAGLQQPIMPGASVVTNFQAGQLRATGVPTDVAIDGAGFFAVQLPNGDTAYTRDGEFQLNAQGELVTKQGYPVMADGGTIQVDRANPAPLSISADGTVSQGADVKGRLTVATFNDTQLLSPISAGYFLATNPALQTSEAAGAGVRQGWLESANTSPVAEMANLIAAMRHYEANQRLIQMHDERMGRAISELGNPNSA